MIKNKEKYLSHINDSSQYGEMRKLLDKIESVCANHEVKYTDFLDPYQTKLSESILNRFDVSYYFEGGVESAERKIAVIFPSYLERESVEKPVVALKIEGISKFNELSHKDFLGAIMGTGIKREKVGDIIISPAFAVVIVSKDILSFLKSNLTKIGRENVELVETDSSEIVKEESEFEYKTVTVSSKRLDSFLSEVYNLPRSKSKIIVNSDKVKVNWAPVNDCSANLYSNDIVSVRKLGRFLVEEELGQTKKGNIRFKIKLYK